MSIRSGAFTPGCSKTHLPGYINDYDKLTKAGAQVIACTSVNDAFVMAAWGEQNHADGKVRLTKLCPTTYRILVCEGHKCSFSLCTPVDIHTAYASAISQVLMNNPI